MAVVDDFMVIEGHKEKQEEAPTSSCLNITIS